MSTPKEKNFYHKVLNSFNDDKYSEDEIKAKQADWQKYTDDSKKPQYENDFPAYFFAGFWIRSFAFLVDLLCIHALQRIILTVFLSADSLPYDVLAIVIYLSYFTLMTKLNKGQTIGKMIFGIRVICLTEKDLSWKTVLVRETFGRYILQLNPLCILFYLPIIFTKRKQQTIDLLTDTSVVTLNLIQAFNQKASL